MNPEELDLTEGESSALVRAALEAYEDALLRGLCAEGAREAAAAVLRASNPPAPGPCRDASGSSDFSMRAPTAAPDREEKKP
jgi:hypothetical protein